MKTDAELQEYIRTHPSATLKQAYDNLHRHGVSWVRVKAAMEAARGPSAILPNPQVRVRPKTLDDFRKAHDNPQKIRNGLASLADGAYLTEEEFRQFCNIPANLWRRNADLPEFSDNHLKHAGIVHWASKTTIQEMKTIIGVA